MVDGIGGREEEGQRRMLATLVIKEDAAVLAEKRGVANSGLGEFERIVQT